MIIEILDNDHDQDKNHDQDDQKSTTQRARLGSTRGALKMKVGSWSAISLHQMQFFCPIGLSLREIFKNEDRDFLRPGTRRGGAGSERGKKGHEGFLKKCFFKNHIESF